jgi:hypothetical protein
MELKHAEKGGKVGKVMGIKPASGHQHVLLLVFPKKSWHINMNFREP